MKKYNIHAEPLSPTIHALRWFSEPLGQIDLETGQPWQEYEASAVLVLESPSKARLVLMQQNKAGAQALPALRRHLRHHHPRIKQVIWERWEIDQKRKKEVTLPV